jgi:hypothetical protein
VRIKYPCLRRLHYIELLIMRLSPSFHLFPQLKPRCCNSNGFYAVVHWESIIDSSRTAMRNISWERYWGTDVILYLLCSLFEHHLSLVQYRLSLIEQSRETTVRAHFSCQWHNRLLTTESHLDKHSIITFWSSLNVFSKSMAMCCKACTVRNLLAAEVAVSNTARGMNVYHLQSVRILTL